jgi:hypothetical protein
MCMYWHCCAINIGVEWLLTGYYYINYTFIFVCVNYGLLKFHVNLHTHMRVLCE